MLALVVVVVEVVVVIVIVIVIGVVIAKLVLVIAVTKLRFGVDVVVVKGSLGRVGWRVDWRKVRVRVRRMRSMCRWYSRRPWRSKWVLVTFRCRGGELLKRLEMVGALSRLGLMAKVCHARAWEWQSVYPSIMSTF